MSMPETILDNSLVMVGDEDIVAGFKAMGFKVYPVKEPKEFSAVLEEILARQAAICLVQENIYRAQEGEISNYKNLPFPIFVPFAKDSKTELLEQIIKSIRLRATGTF